jgi:hypothetical protein
VNWREAHEEGMFAAAEAHEELGVNPRRQIDIFAAIRDAGLELLFRPLRGVSGLLCRQAVGSRLGCLSPLITHCRANASRLPTSWATSGSTTRRALIQ